MSRTTVSVLSDPPARSHDWLYQNRHEHAGKWFERLIDGEHFGYFYVTTPYMAMPSGKIYGPDVVIFPISASDKESDVPAIAVCNGHGEFRCEAITVRPVTAPFTIKIEVAP